MDTEDDLARRVRQGHATAEHLHEFEDLNVRTPDQYEKHVASVLRDPQTRRFTAYTTAQQWRQADIYYHHPSNTLIVHPANRQHEPTAHRPPEGVEKFERKHREAQEIERRQIAVQSRQVEQQQVQGARLQDLPSNVRARERERQQELRARREQERELRRALQQGRGRARKRDRSEPD